MFRHFMKLVELLFNRVKYLRLLQDGLLEFWHICHRIVLLNHFTPCEVSMKWTHIAATSSGHLAVIELNLVTFVYTGSSCLN